VSDESTDLTPRSAAEVARRCIALLAVIERAYAKDDSYLRSWPEHFDLSSLLSAEEKAFYDSPNPSRDDIIKFSWRAEALVPLLWALQLIPDLPPLNEKVDLSTYIAIQHANADPERFIASASLRPAEELEETEADLFDNHWRVRDARLFRRPCPPDLDPDIVYERRYGMSWVLGWGETWDDVPTDT